MKRILMSLVAFYATALSTVKSVAKGEALSVEGIEDVLATQRGALKSIKERNKASLAHEAEKMAHAVHSADKAEAKTKELTAKVIEKIQEVEAKRITSIKDECNKAVFEGIQAKEALFAEANKADMLTYKLS